MRCTGANQKEDIAVPEDVVWEVIARAWQRELNSGYTSTFLFPNTVLFLKEQLHVHSKIEQKEEIILTDPILLHIINAPYVLLP